MRVGTKFFQELSKRKYLESIRSLPDIKQETTHQYMAIILSFFAFSFFGMFAITPTLSTIAELRKNLEDSKFIESQLQTKIENMSTLQQQYNSLSPQVPTLLAALPQTPQTPILYGQIRALAQESGVEIIQMQSDPVLISSLRNNDVELQSYQITINAEGSFPQLSAFSSSLIKMERLITLQGITLVNPRDNGNIRMMIRASAYFKP